MSVQNFQDFLVKYKERLAQVFATVDDKNEASLKRGIEPSVLSEIVEFSPLSAFIPSEYGGFGGNTSEALAMLEASSYQSLPVSLMMGINGALFLQPLANYGTEEAKQQVFNRVVNEGKMGGLMITEPDYGSDALKMQTSFTKNNDKFNIEGVKHWGGLTGIADYWLITARGINDPLMEQNPSNGRTSKVRSYTFYAIGEILLVMIGILLALQVSNWNEDRKKATDTLLYHQRLIEDMDLVIGDLENALEFAEGNFDAGRTSLEILQSGTRTERGDSLMNLFLDRYYKFTISLEDFNTYKEMQSTGKLDLIKSTDLKDGFSTLVDRIEFYLGVNRSFNRTTLSTSDYIERYLMYSFPESEDGSTKKVITYDFETMSKDDELVRRISRQTMFFDESIRITRSFIQQVKSVRELLISEYAKLKEAS